ncbi:MAG TPA: alpha/beta hydrolase [Candidatus Dormibacteraeota bacterium]|jgi:pimeloyl-ACP methyl ester carboxylesterase|nr:alpha/beta hydrolase [Candidatus Dormibacteraeota bacterium]
MPYFDFEGFQLAYSIYGEGKRTLVLTHGQLLNQRMHEPLARDLARRGNRVITLDLLGHGRSDRPQDQWRYTFGLYAQQVVALLDHLDIDEAVIGGTSLGANVTLEVAMAAPERCRGLIVEMPVLDNGILAAVQTFTPLLLVLKYGRPLVSLLGWALTPIPRGLLPLIGKIVLDAIRQDHAASPAILTGQMMGRIAPDHPTRMTIDMPTLVIGHPGDPVHPLADAELLTSEMPRARLVEANNILEMRLYPDRLTGEIADFLESAWRPQRARAARRRRKAG